MLLARRMPNPYPILQNLVLERKFALADNELSLGPAESGITTLADARPSIPILMNMTEHPDFLRAWTHGARQSLRCIQAACELPP